MSEFLLPESAWPATLPTAQRSLLGALRDGLRQTPDVSGIAAGGSFITGEVDEFSDLDLVVVVEDTAWPAVLERRKEIAARLGPLLAAFTGEHVGEPRLLICLYGPPLIHVDLTFLPLSALERRVEDPVLLWDRRGSVAPRLSATKGRYPGPDRQWIEDRFWIWVHYAAAKLARGELFETLNMLAYLRSQVLGPMALAEAGVQPNGVRRVEQRTGPRTELLKATVARYDRHDAARALQAAIDLYRQLRGPRAISPVEAQAVAFARRVAGIGAAPPLMRELAAFLAAVLIGSLVGLWGSAALDRNVGLALGTTATAATHARLVHRQPLRLLLPKTALAAPLAYLVMRGVHVLLGS